MDGVDLIASHFITQSVDTVAAVLSAYRMARRSTPPQGRTAITSQFVRECVSAPNHLRDHLNDPRSVILKRLSRPELVFGLLIALVFAEFHGLSVGHAPDMDLWS